MMAASNSVSGKYNLIELEKYKAIFQAAGADFSSPVPQYMIFQARIKKAGTQIVASFYESGKFVVQGAAAGEFCANHLGINANGTSPVKTTRASVESEVPFPHIGIDESGKGDFFGPLVIAGAYLDENGAQKCLEWGVCDSKKLNDKTILNLAQKIKTVAIFDIVAIGNKKYNELYSKFKNLNRLLAWGHVTVLENILGKTPCELAISDKFADESVILNSLKEKGKKIRLIQKTKAEADVAVAAASILARAEFVTRLSKLAAQYEIELPKGASNKVLKQGKAFISKFGTQEMQNVAKLHFKTLKDCMG